MKTKISVVIPAFNEELRIATCLNKILAQIEKPFEIIVVDNNSTDKTARIAKKMGAKVVKESVQGRRAARDAGFNAATGDIIARIDADTLIPPDWTRKIREHFEKDEKLMGVSGSAHYYDFPEMLQYKNWIIPGASQFVKFFRRHDGLFGFNLALRKSVWEKIKGEICLDDDKIHEDTDLAIHIAKYGKVLLDKTILVETSLRQLQRKKEYFDYFVLKTLRSVDPRRHH
jgi:glycosyltransferase involved in cell wall biosynthesis